MEFIALRNTGFESRAGSKGQVSYNKEEYFWNLGIVGDNTAPNNCCCGRSDNPCMASKWTSTGWSRIDIIGKLPILEWKKIAVNKREFRVGIKPRNDHVSCVDMVVFKKAGRKEEIKKKLSP